MESVSDFPFHKLKHITYPTMEVMMHVDYEDALKFMFKINKQGRGFLIKKFNTVRNGFMNDGLIDICFSDDPFEQFNNYDQLEKHYILALIRNVSNRILTISLNSSIYEKEFKI